MQPDERMNIPLIALRRALRGYRADIWTALPAQVVSYDPAKRTVSLQPTIQAQVQNQEGAWSNVNLPVLPDVPVCFLGAGNYIITVPVKEGDEGVVVFSARCIDAFWQSGGVQPQAESRMHDLSDGMFFPAPLSQAQEIPNVDPDKLQIRTKDGSRYVEISDTLIKAKGNVEVEGNLHVTGQITGPNFTFGGGGAVVAITGGLEATEDIVAKAGTPGSVTLSEHLHGGVQPGGGSTTPPTGGT